MRKAIREYHFGMSQRKYGTAPACNRVLRHRTQYPKCTYFNRTMMNVPRPSTDDATHFLTIQSTVLSLPLYTFLAKPLDRPAAAPSPASLDDSLMRVYSRPNAPTRVTKFRLPPFLSHFARTFLETCLPLLRFLAPRRPWLPPRAPHAPMRAAPPLSPPAPPSPPSPACAATASRPSPSTR